MAIRERSAFRARRGRAPLVAVVGLVYLFPLYWLTATAFKKPIDVFATPPRLLFRPTLDNFVLALQKNDFLRLILNSLIASAGGTILALVLGFFAAWGVARHKIGGSALLLGVLTARTIPVIALVIPLFLVFIQFNLVDTYLTLPLAFLVENLPFVIWMMKGFIDEIPYEIEESAMLDGASTLTVLLRITLPLSTLGLVATGTFVFMFSWNELVLSIVLTRIHTKTAMVGLSSLAGIQQAIPWGEISAAALLVVVPLFLLAFFTRRFLVRGMTAGALK